MVSVASLPRPCLTTSGEVNKSRWPHTCSRQCAFEEKKHEITSNSLIIVAHTKKNEHIFLAFSTPVAVSYHFFHVFPGEVPSATPKPRALHTVWAPS